MPIGNGIGGGRAGAPNFLASPGRRPSPNEVPFRSAPFAQLARLVTGVTRDSGGNPLGGCTVELFDTRTDQRVAATVSDGSGNFSLPGASGPYYLVCYKAGTPDLAGTSVNTLTGV